MGRSHESLGKQLLLDDAKLSLLRISTTTPRKHEKMIQDRFHFILYVPPEGGLFTIYRIFTVNEKRVGLFFDFFLFLLERKEKRKDAFQRVEAMNSAKSSVRGIPRNPRPFSWQ